MGESSGSVGKVVGGVRPATTANSTWISLNQALVPPFALTLHAGKIRAIFGIRFRVSNRAVGLMGDRLTVGQMVLQPQMYQSAGSMADQTKHLNKLSFNPPALDEAIEALAGGASVVEPATEDAGTAVTVPALLVVHPKIGALFIEGLLPLGALRAARTIRTAVPEAPVATELWSTSACQPPRQTPPVRPSPSSPFAVPIHPPGSS